MSTLDEWPADPSEVPLKERGQPCIVLGQACDVTVRPQQQRGGPGTIQPLSAGP